MLTEDKVTEIFCIADDFCKLFDAQLYIRERKTPENVNITVNREGQTYQYLIR